MRADTDQLWDDLRRQRLLPVLRADDPADAALGASVLVDEGTSIIELTTTTGGHLRALERLVAARPEARIGMGTVTDGDTARRAVDAGAYFIVTPGTPAGLLDELATLLVPVIPGIGSVTEVVQARRCGHDVVKLFPARHFGPRWLRDVSGPFPDLAVIPTGGIDLDAVTSWLTAGALAVGLGANLCSPEHLRAHDWEAVRANLARARRAAELAAAIDVEPALRMPPAVGRDR